MRTIKEAKDYIKENVGYTVDLIQDALDICCPCDCDTCLWERVCCKGEDNSVKESEET